MAPLAELEQQLRDEKDILKEGGEMLAVVEDEEDIIAAKTMIEESEARILDLQSQIAAEEARSHVSVAAPPPPPPPPPSQEVPAPSNFNVGDVVQARWSEDKLWYAATIVSKMGSSADPVYTVTFTGYGNTETKRSNEVRPSQDPNRKRKADAISSTPAPAAPPAAKSAPAGTVISGAPAIDPSKAQKRVPSMVSDGPMRMPPAPKKIKNNKALDKAKNSWNAWQKNGPKKAPVGASTKINKESQFRTPEGVNARGSGKPMQPDQARKKFTYNPVEQPEYDDD